MRVLHLSKYDLRGGAAIAARNSVRAQRNIGLDARLWVARKLCHDDWIVSPDSAVERLLVLGSFAMERAPFRLLGFPPTDVRSTGMFGVSPLRQIRQFDPDIVVLHNIDGAVPLRILPQIKRPIVWRMHDMWPATATAHYQPEDDTGGGRISKLIDAWVGRRKRAVLSKIKTLALCPPSNWMGEVAARSPYLADRPQYVIPNGVDEQEFRASDRGEARDRLGIPSSARVILFGAAGGTTDPRKGADLLAAALIETLPRLRAANAHLLVFGGDPGELVTLGLPVVSVGHVSSRSALCDLCTAADLCVVPSRMENLSLTILEALSCGTPVLAYKIGGNGDVIVPGCNGWLAPQVTANSLATTLELALADLDNDQGFRMRSRASVEAGLTLEHEARRMAGMFDNILNAEVGRAYQRTQ